MTQCVRRCSPEVKIAEEVCSQFIYVKLGRVDEDAARQEVLILLRLERELDQNYGLMLDHICDRIDICSENIYSHPLYFCTNGPYGCLRCLLAAKLIFGVLATIVLIRNS